MGLSQTPDELTLLAELEWCGLVRATLVSYLPFTTERLREKHNGTKAICFDWRVRKATNRGYDRCPRVVFNKNPAAGEVREQTITAAFNSHGDGSPDNFKKQLLHLVTLDEQIELSEGRSRLRLIKYVSIPSTP